MIPKNESAVAGTNRLIKDRSRISESIPERSPTELARYLSDEGRLSMITAGCAVSVTRVP